jgi:hypothetical protein
MDHGVREKTFDRPVREPPGFRTGDPLELEVVDAGRRHVANGRDPEEREGLLDALGLGVHDAGLELDTYLDPNSGRGRGIVLLVRSYRTGEITNAPAAGPGHRRSRAPRRILRRVAPNDRPSIPGRVPPLTGKLSRTAQGQEEQRPFEHEQVTHLREQGAATRIPRRFEVPRAGHPTCRSRPSPGGASVTAIGSAGTLPADEDAIVFSTSRLRGFYPFQKPI